METAGQDSLVPGGDGGDTLSPQGSAGTLAPGGGAGTLERHRAGPGPVRTGPRQGTHRQRRAAPAPAGAPWWRRAARDRFTQQAALLAAFTAAGVAATWPRATYTGGRLPASRDTATYVWGFWWLARQAQHLANPWFTNHMAAPVGVPLGFHALMPLPGLLLSPVTLLAGPAAACNLLVVLVPGLLSYATYRAARLWLASAAGTVAAGAFFGLSAMLAQQDWYHLNIAAGAAFLPMALEASVRLRRTPGTRQGVILGLVMGAALLTDAESAVLAGIVTGLTLVPWLAGRPAWSRVRPTLLAAGVGAAAGGPQVLAMALEIARAHGGLAIPPHLLAVSYKQYGIGLPGMFAPGPRVADFGLGSLAGPFQHGRDNEGMPMFGAVLTGMALAGLAAAWRRRSAWRLAALWAGCAALALGPSLWLGKHQYLPLAQSWHGVRVSVLMPYTWFVRLPGLSGFREADRLAILGLLPAALLAGAAVDWLRFHARPLIVAVLALGVLEAGYPGSAKVGVMTAGFPAADRPIAADHTQSTVLDVPFGVRGGIPVYGEPFFPQALVMATADGHPRSIAYSARVPLATIRAVDAHPFYRGLVYTQHEVPPSCPWAPPGPPTARGYHRDAPGCLQPAGVAVRDRLKLSPAQLAAAKWDARRAGIRWVVVWRRNISIDTFVLRYLKKTGFRFAYRAGVVLVYRHW